MWCVVGLLKIPPDIYIYVSELYSMMPTEIATSSLNFLK